MGGNGMIYCPICKGTMVGRIGQGRYYCRNCYYEFQRKDGVLLTFTVNEDGSLAEFAGR